MAKSEPKIKYLKDYKPSDFLINSVFLYFDLHEDITFVRTVLDIKRNFQFQQNKAPLILNGEDLVLKSLRLNGEILSPSQYQVDQEQLIIRDVPNHFILETEVEIKPQNNTQLMGLYKSRGNFCTQCESEGFRRITYFIDRPDIMTHFTTCISADKKRYPVLLSNGNLVEEKNLSNDRHWVKWEDPSLKSPHLFALVAGDFDCLEDEFVTRSGRTVALRVYVEKGKLDQAHFAMESLKHAMEWDERTYDREYELDIYMIVAVNDFNFGAMENKGLNIFNDKYILANPKTATDEDFINVEGVVGHEYFHNWSGNRVTVRDWFQITLKEGLTIFRDQNFSADTSSPVIDRIDAANIIRTTQFSQDAGPMAHPIRPDSYMEVTNFYTVTVYNKGAEVIRMIETMIGVEKFKEGLNLYFSRHDGQAVTTEEFVKAMEDASGLDLTQFRNWYHQAGTPELEIRSDYDEKRQIYTLMVKQSCPPTPGQFKKENFHIPLATGLLDSKTGKDILNPSTKILHIKNTRETFEFPNIQHRPIPSLLRSFSAPVKVNYHYSDDELLFLMVSDSDGFNRWDAGQKLAEKILLKTIKDYQQQKTLSVNPELIKAFQKLLTDTSLNQALLAEMLRLPSMAYLFELLPVVDIPAMYHAREFVKTELARKLRSEFLQLYQNTSSSEPYHFDEKEVGRRNLKNLCLSYLLQLNDAEGRKLAVEQFHNANNMTDELGALKALMNVECSERISVFNEFYKKWQHEGLVVDKWFSLQAASTLPETLKTVKELLKHSAFDIKNPNRVRAVVGSFCSTNYINFHDVKGEGYEFLADQVLKINLINSQLAARMLEPLTRWHKFDTSRQALIKKQLERIAKAPELSKDVYEIVEKSLNFKPVGGN